MIGQTVGKYRIVSRLGRGGMGTVYQAVDETLGRDVAIKILNSDLADTEVLQRFRAEALMLARLNHPNIATLYELTEHGGDLLMVMELVRGETFDRMSERLGPLPFDLAAALCSQVLDALGHAHRAGVVHRDLKPANLMSADTGVVKVMDFGIARMIGTERLTMDGYMMGTPAYMAPEQVMGEELDGRADLYAIGVVLYRLLTANLPFKADTAIAMARKQVKDPPTPLYQFRVELPASCQAIIDRALAKARHERFQSAEEFRAALTQAVASSSASARGQKNGDSRSFLRKTAAVPISGVTRLGTSPVAGMILVAGAAVVIGLTIVAWGVTRQKPSAPPQPLTAVGSSAAPATATAPPLVTAPPAESSAVAPSPAPPPAIPASPSRATVLPPLLFQPVVMLTIEDGKSREHDASLLLTETAFQVVARSQRVKSAPYSAISGIFYSRSKEPRYVTPKGSVAAVAKVEASKLRLFGSATRDWLTVRARNDLISIRADSSIVEKAIDALRARTGVRVTRVSEKH